jgi:hypothetical protein
VGRNCALDAGLLLVPMLAWLIGRIPGRLQWGGTAGMGTGLAELFDERLAHLRIAHQTGIAIDNIRLLKFKRRYAL